MSAPPDPSTTHRSAPAGAGHQRFDRLLAVLARTAVLLAPVLFLVETSGPRWLNLTLRASWVAVVAGFGALLVLGRARTRRARADGAVA